MYACNDDTFETRGRTSPGGLLAAPARVIGRMLRRAARRAEEHRAATTLLSMDDHLLRDIGVSRPDVVRIVRDGQRAPAAERRGESARRARTAR